MRVPRIFSHETLAVDQEVVLSDQARIHICQVLRMEIGQAIRLFNGDGFDYEAKISQVGKTAKVNIIHRLENSTESPIFIHLGQVISRGDKMDLTLQKAVELGVSTITPLFSERCGVKLPAERMAKKLEHWQKIMISACEQSGRSFIPSCDAPSDFVKWLSTVSADLKILLDPLGQKTLAAFAETKPRSVIVAIGPEGGFTDQEVKQAKQAGFEALKLGTRILRTETAAFSLISVLQYLFGDF